ncbi:Armadillo repeat-containing protein 3 [Homalodisca vitripennis]|nr:Armadillo repeat-containing protein 3 [Homalodisca vitripennis]
MVKSNKTTISNKKHEDRELASKTAFESTSVEIQSSHTMILLLASKEDFVILKALFTLDKYASKMEQNARVLYEEGILTLLLPLLNHSELFVKRFATKLLSEMNFLPPVTEILLQEKFVSPIMNMINSIEDFVVKEFSLCMIAELTRSKAGLSQLLETNLIHILLPLLVSPDPDIKKNSLQIIYNIIQDPHDHSVITSLPEFTIKPLIDLLMSEYVAIQNLSLDVLNILTQHRKDNKLSKDFQDAGGVLKILSILKNFEWKDVHGKCLDVLGNIYDDPNIAQNFLKDGVLQLFSYMDFVNDLYLRRKAIEVIAKVTNTRLGRKVLVESGLISKLVSMVQEQGVGLAAAVCQCVAGLTQDYQALQQMLEQDIVRELLIVMADPDRAWDSRTAATRALFEILQRDVDSCNFVVESEMKDVFESILSQYDEKMPALALIMTCNCITVLGSHPATRKKVVSPSLISSLLGCFRELPEDTMPLKLSACEALCGLLSEPETRHYLRALNGLETVWSAITQRPNNIQFLQSAATFLHLCVTNDKGFTATLLRLNALNWLLSQGGLRNECPVWEVALETILNKFLPIKFAMTGRLDLTDITDSNFYITKLSLTRNQLDKNKFPILEYFIVNNCCPIQILYVANFEENYRLSSSGSLTSKRTASTKSILSKNESVLSMTNSYKCEKFRYIDVYLQEYIETMKTILNKNGFLSIESDRKDSVVDGDTIKKKTLLIGEFVAKQMGGTDRFERCSIHNLDLHVNELKVEIMNSIIPVGWMRVGLHLERAFLFKVLADQVGLPAALVRGQYHQRGWVEIAVPCIPPAPRPAYPHHLLRPSHVVDLMASPVTLYPLNSYEASVYCGLV